MIVYSVYTAAGCKNKLPDFIDPGKIQHLLQPDHICLLVCQGVFNTGSYACFCGNVHNYIHWFFYKAGHFFYGTKGDILFNKLISW